MPIKPNAAAQENTATIPMKLSTNPPAIEPMTKPRDCAMLDIAITEPIPISRPLSTAIALTEGMAILSKIPITVKRTTNRAKLPIQGIKKVPMATIAIPTLGKMTLFIRSASQPKG